MPLEIPGKVVVYLPDEIFPRMELPKDVYEAIRECDRAWMELKVHVWKCDQVLRLFNSSARNWLDRFSHLPLD